MIEHLEVRAGEYHDSVVLMQASRKLAAVDGVDAALVAMATDLNLRLLVEMGFEPEGSADPNELVVAIRARDEGALAAARQTLDDALTAKTGDGSGMFESPSPRTAGSAARRVGANLVLVSVPGAHAFVEAMEALAFGAHVMVFSNDVPLAEERALKAEAERRGLLVMGPDCGTAVIGGVGLGFANAVRHGPVGIVGASGTGIQQLCCLLDDAGVGVSHALGVGSRDLSGPVGGASTLRALSALDDDPSTDVIVVISRRPDATVARAVRHAASMCSTPTVLAFLGEDGTTLEGAARETLGVLGRASEEPRRWTAPPPPHRDGALRGLFAGGSLCEEAGAIAAASLGEITSNVLAGPDWSPEEGGALVGHALIDFGDERLTQGRAHPMIDQRLRLDRMREDVADPSVSVILLDVVLGYGAHANPAAELSPLIAEAKEAGIAVVVSLCGCAGDPQGLEQQASALHAAGASVWLSNAAAARHAVTLVEGGE